MDEAADLVLTNVEVYYDGLGYLLQEKAQQRPAARQPQTPVGHGTPSKVISQPFGVRLVRV
jgi:hypothetical protein